MMGNTYFLYVVVMLLIAAFAASTIAGINFSLSVAKESLHRDWRYRLKVLLVLAAIGSAMVAIIVHDLMAPPS